MEAKKIPDAIAVARALQKQRPKEAVGFASKATSARARRNGKRRRPPTGRDFGSQPTTELAIKLHVVLTAAGKAPESERFAATWVSAHPKDSGFVTYLGDAALARKDYAPRKSTTSPCSSPARHAPALNNLAWITQQLRKPGALAYAEKANALAPNQPAFMDTLAMLLSGEGRPRQGRRLADEGPRAPAGKCNLEVEPGQDLHRFRREVARQGPARCRDQARRQASLVRGGQRPPQNAVTDRWARRDIKGPRL